MPKTTQPTELDQRLNDLEKGHGKIADVGDELRIIGMEYADIRSRIESTDLLIDHMIHQLDAERRMRRITTLLILVLLVLTSILVMRLAMGF